MDEFQPLIQVLLPEAPPYPPTPLVAFRTACAVWSLRPAGRRKRGWASMLEQAPLINPLPFRPLLAGRHALA